MADGRYIFRNCVPDGDIDIINVEPGEIIQREWSFRVNMPPEMQEELDSGDLDPRNIMTGKDGELYDEDGNFLAEVNTFQGAVSVTNTDYQPAGEYLEWAITTGYSLTLTFTETLIRDEMLASILKSLKKKEKTPQMNFTGVLRGA